MTKTKELPTNIETWVTALESGEYDQCKGTLHNGEGYCCLGVYAKVVLGYGDESIRANGLVNGGVGPEEVYKEIRGLHWGYSGVYETGVDMNDSGNSFIDIAKMIREAYT
tara:strand:- start:84 stop:413 length:330 start_codon:yes stop_codon:yes gene_type:complete